MSSVFPPQAAVARSAVRTSVELSARLMRLTSFCGCLFDGMCRGVVDAHVAQQFATES